MGTSLDWTKLREHQRSVSRAFEALCCLLAEHGPDEADRRCSGWRFFRKGTPDAGCECLWTAPNGDEYGWQAKWFIGPISDTRWTELDGSVRTAMERHPRLIEYTVCIPQNQSDPRQPNAEWFKDRWDRRVEMWRHLAPSAGRVNQYDYRGDHQLCDQLMQSRHIGRRMYFFEDKLFTPVYFQRHVQSQLKNAEPRYTPDLSVDLEIAQFVEALARTPQWRSRCGAAVDGFVNAADRLMRLLGGRRLASIRRRIEAIIEKVRKDGNSFRQPPDTPSASAQLLSALKDLTPLFGQLEQHDREPKADEMRKPTQPSYRYALDDFRRVVAGLWGLFESPSANAAVSGRILVTGEAGAGKTHLVCDLADRLVKRGLPCLLFLGQQMRSSGPLRQMQECTGLGFASYEEFLGSLNTAGEMVGARAVIFVDALNETIDDPKHWVDELPGMLEMMKDYPFVSLALTVRTSYKKYVVPPHLGPEELPVIDHPGFGDVVVDATERFFDHFNIRAPEYPTLEPEFTSPLFLKLFCVAVADTPDPEHKLPPKTIPKGLRGFTQIVDTIIEKSNDRLVRAMSLNCDRVSSPVKEAVSRLARRMTVDHARILSLDVAADIVGTVLRPTVAHAEPLQAMVSDGLLSRDVFFDPQRNVRVEGVRFAYERFTSHILMELTLSDTFDPKEPHLAFAESKPLGQLVRPTRPWLDSPSDVAALLLQLPERYQIELFDAYPDATKNAEIAELFLKSFTWRDSASITKGTREAVQKVLDEHPEFWRSWVLVLLSLALRDDQPLNALYLHARLAKMSLPIRDSTWSILIHHSFADDGQVARMIRWAWRPEAPSQISDKVALLYGVVLAWFFTSSNRSLRDRATKAAVSILTPRLPVLRRLLATFESVDDPYVSERLYAVAYGCCIRSKDIRGIASLAEYVYNSVFKDGKPPPNILLRDYARGIIEFAAIRGGVKNMELNKIRPPYTSAWPTRLPTKRWNGKRVDFSREMTNVERAEAHLGSSIMGPESDFYRYILVDRLLSWSRYRIGAKRPRTRSERRGHFFASLTPPQLQAWRTYEEQSARSERERLRELRARQQVGVTATDAHGLNGAEDDARERALRAFVQTLGEIKRREFRTVSRTLRPPSRLQPPRMNVGAVCRWMFQRALQIGAISEPVARFDRNVQYEGRTEHGLERFGKKYQWIAFYECLARLADNFVLCGDVDRDATTTYDGPWQFSRIRNIDPSWTAHELERSAWGPHKAAWWCPLVYDWYEAPSHAEWIAIESDLPDPKLLLQPKGWLCLSGDFGWRQEVPYGRRLSECALRNFEAWTSAYVVRVEAAESLEHWLWSASADGSHLMPDHILPQGRSADAFLGERYWSPASHSFNGPFHYGEKWAKFGPEEEAIEVCATFEKYFDDSGYDCSFDGALTARLPSEWLSEQMGLRWNGRNAEFVDKRGAVVAFDPSVESAGPPVLLVDAEPLRRFLARSGYAIVWLYQGVKSVLWGEREAGPRPQRRFVLGVYTLGQEGLKGRCHSALENR